MMNDQFNPDDYLDGYEAGLNNPLPPVDDIADDYDGPVPTDEELAQDFDEFEDFMRERGLWDDFKKLILNRAWNEGLSDAHKMRRD